MNQSMKNIRNRSRKVGKIKPHCVFKKRCLKNDKKKEKRSKENIKGTND